MISKAKNKKAISYFSLIGIIAIVLFVLLFIAYISPTSGIKNDLDFGKTTKEIDLINYKLAAEEFYFQEEVERSLNKAKLDFSKTYGLSKEDQLKIAENSCIYNNVHLWYNEKNKKSDSETDENSNLNINLCMPDFKEGSKKAIEDYISQKVSEDLKSDMYAFKTYSDPKVQITEQKDGKVKVSISCDYEENTKIGNVKKTSKYEKEYDTSGYSILLESISNSLPVISSRAEDEVPLCVKQKSNYEEGSNPEILCIKETITNLIKEKYLEVEGKEEEFSNYDFNVIDLKGEKGYYALQIVITNKKTTKKEVDFGVIFKDAIPTSLIQFGVESFSKADNTLNVKILEPKEAYDINSYIVIYSYEDFFNSESYSNYNKLISMLETNLVPSDFVQSGISDENGAYYYSKPESNLNLNLLVVGKDNFLEDDISKTKYKNIQLYQSFNYNEKAWELFQSSRPVYVFVFATDYNKNYYVKELSGKSISAIPQTVFGSLPLTLENVKYSDSILGLDNSFSFEISGYEDENFNHYDLYITKDRGDKELKENCIGTDFLCTPIIGNSILTQKNGKYLITSSQITNKEGYDKVLSIGNSILETGKETEVFLIPVDKNGKGTISSQFKEYSLSQKNEHYELTKESDGMRFEPYSFKITPKDSSKPNPLTSIEISMPSIIPKEDGNYYLQWASKPGENIVKLYVSYQAYDSTGLKASFTKKEIIDGNLGLSTGVEYTQITVSRIIPIDSSGNYEDFDLYQGQTYTASYP